MAVPTAPLLSFAASGQIAKSLVFSKWKGRPYIRRYVVPANPQSTAQTLTRDTFAWGNAVWKVAPALLQAPWDLFATGQVLTGRNAFLSSVVRNLRGDADLTDIVFSPGAKGGLAADSIVVTPGVGTLTVDFTNPGGPTGWTLDSAIACVIKDQDPASGTLYQITADEDAVTQNQVVFTGLDNVLYSVGAWLQWSKDDGSTAYGPSITDTGTPT